MDRGTVTLSIVSYWHAGSGRGDGPGADAVIVRDGNGLPYLPGRTVKGLVRAAVTWAAAAGMVDDARLTEWFGTDLPESPATGRTSATDDREKRLEEARFATRPGSLRFGSATLGEKWAQWAASHPIDRELLVQTHASTRLDQGGIAKDESLRLIEIAVPMTLRARVEGLSEESTDAIRSALPLFLRSLGASRRRGLGRVVATLDVD